MIYNKEKAKQPKYKKLKMVDFIFKCHVEEYLRDQ